MIEAPTPTMTEDDASGFEKFATFAFSGAEVLQSTQEPMAVLTTVPDELRYAGSIHPELRTVEPFEVRFERAENGYAAVIQEIDEYGLGETRSEALEDLRKTLQELYISLECDESKLSGDLLSVWTRLKQHVKRIHR